MKFKILLLVVFFVCSSSFAIDFNNSMRGLHYASRIGTYECFECENTTGDDSFSYNDFNSEYNHSESSLNSITKYIEDSKGSLEESSKANLIKSIKSLNDQKNKKLKYYCYDKISCKLDAFYKEKNKDIKGVRESEEHSASKKLNDVFDSLYNYAEECAELVDEKFLREILSKYNPLTLYEKIGRLDAKLTNLNISNNRLEILKDIYEMAEDYRLGLTNSAKLSSIMNIFNIVKEYKKDVNLILKEHLKYISSYEYKSDAVYCKMQDKIESYNLNISDSTLIDIYEIAKTHEVQIRLKKPAKC